MTPCRPVGAAEIADAPLRFANSVDLAITPEQLFEVLADAEAWPHWAKAITQVTWTSPGAADGDIGVGSTRTVGMRGGIVGEEEFFDWDPPRTMGFHFTSANIPDTDAFGEYYEVVATAEGCRLTWTLALWPTGAQRVVARLSGPVQNLAFRWFLRNLRRYTDQRFAR
ncbi:SRPBCC family protein [Nocardioides sp. CBS4Y-1]|uniref:SRPBCC family protein n=2 Tax=Nocardioides acrostichi TaxID=2784339 RepID=A0A930Y713_9ACTN|nr:SRPBCC family protein [Nocardioides acrostichi]